MKLYRAPVLLLLATISTALAAPDPGDAVRSRIRREPVVSSNVASVGYSRHLRALEIEFTRGAVYRFLGVPPKVHQGLIAARSKGRFIAEYIRGRYRFIRVRAQPGQLATGGTQPDY